VKLNLECSAADLYLIAQAFQLAEMQADRSLNTSRNSQSCRTYSRRSRVSADVSRKRQDTFEYQKELYAGLHEMFLDAIPQGAFKVSVEDDGDICNPIKTIFTPQ
jgi:hypothetical protein